MSISFYPEPVPGEVAIARRKYGEYYQLSIWPYYPDIARAHVPIKEIANALEEACGLARTGFEYFIEIEEIQIFRKRK